MTDKHLCPRKEKILSLEGDDLALLPGRLFAYALKKSRFVPLDVRYVKEIDWRDDGFSRLQLDESHKRMIQGSVRALRRRRRIERTIKESNTSTLFTQDFIRGKGRGLVIMLHGEPGIGKTATAEAVAQAHKRPLFPIHLTTSLWDLEDSLTESFRLADLWDCILLIDEADVLLESRKATEFFQNSIVPCKSYFQLSIKHRDLMQPNPSI
ncbi:hypothetical protein QQZ08_005523 [Neonectria magnoliae]|uniref:AAA+ ATPase domain-containing protein n=1 Tax=Neonectria magnoliae TaxID=2732573 RepID=A0ABR1I3I3_9HYPO